MSNPTNYPDDLHRDRDGSTFVVVESHPGRELRARRVRDGVRLEVWTRDPEADTALSPEAIARLNVLAQRRFADGSENGR